MESESESERAGPTREDGPQPVRARGGETEGGAQPVRDGGGETEGGPQPGQNGGGQTEDDLQAGQNNRGQTEDDPQPGRGDDGRTRDSAQPVRGRGGGTEDNSRPVRGGGEAEGVLRVVLADDHPVVRTGLAALLESVRDGTPRVSVVGVASGGREAVRAAVTLRPHVVVMDIRMPDMNGIEATREIGRVAPAVAVLMLTMVEEDDSVFAAMRAGARGYVLKGAGQDEIVRAIRAVAAGEAIFGPGVARRVLGQLSRPLPQPDPCPALTPRERDVLTLIAAGTPNATVAARLGLSPKTVSNHMSAVLAKLGVADRTEAVAWARDAGLGPAVDP